MVKKWAPAKLNIGLDIVGLREDGYHLLDTIMQTVDIFDELEFEPRDDGEVILECDSEYVPADDSLVVKAVRALTDKGMSIKMKCNIPSRAGMGAGSSDAATTLKAVNEIYCLGKTAEELETIGSRLGADVPFFIKGGRQRCQGIGEILTELKKETEYYVVVKPEDEAITKSIFSKYDEWISSGGKEKCTRDYINVLEPVTAQEHPVIYEIKDKLIKYGARLASMTGSGTAVFGVFDSIEAAEKCIKQIGEGFLCQVC